MGPAFISEVLVVRCATDRVAGHVDVVRDRSGALLFSGRESGADPGVEIATDRRIVRSVHLRPLTGDWQLAGRRVPNGRDRGVHRAGLLLRKVRKGEVTAGRGDVVGDDVSDALSHAAASAK